ncbi:carboxyl transferase domain-containing protein [Fodinibius sp.]|uniref:carboxyl transferase domain-containing protein n=1 Tax=Fodinibius sp. TaxID=1872440 RepID=UPI003A0FE0A9
MAGRKLTRHLDLCDLFHIPLLNLVDNPGFAVGVEHEQAGTIRAGGQWMIAFAQDTAVPIFTVIMRRSFGVSRQQLRTPPRAAPSVRVVWPAADAGGHTAGRRASRQPTNASLPKPKTRSRCAPRPMARIESARGPTGPLSKFQMEEMDRPAGYTSAGSRSGWPPPTGSWHADRDSWARGPCSSGRRARGAAASACSCPTGGYRRTMDSSMMPPEQSASRPSNPRSIRHHSNGHRRHSAADRPNRPGRRVFRSSRPLPRCRGQRAGSSTIRTATPSSPASPRPGSSSAETRHRPRSMSTAGRGVSHLDATHRRLSGRRSGPFTDHLFPGPARVRGIQRPAASSSAAR